MTGKAKRLTRREVCGDLLTLRVVAVHPCIIDGVRAIDDVCCGGIRIQCVLGHYFDAHTYVWASIYDNQQMFRNDFGDKRT